MFDIDTIIITVMGVRASAMTVFSLNRQVSSDSLEKDRFLLALTQSTFLNLNSHGVTLDITRDSLSTSQRYIHSP